MDIKRSCGVLLPVTSLPSKHGIGTLGSAAYDFIDFLNAAGQSWWQILPVGPTGCGDSPYQSFSSFAGNPYLIDLDELVRGGLLTESEVRAVNWGSAADCIDYGTMYEHRNRLLALAASRGLECADEAFSAFCAENEPWLSDYALYMAVKKHFSMQPWMQWDEPIKLREPKAVRHYSEELRDEILSCKYVQYLFFSQWKKLRAYAHEKGIGIIGDMPIYVALDSADAWAEPEFFELDENNVPAAVAGVPPDYFSSEGQLWGNPLYAWDRLRSDGYGWWIRRVDGASRLYDALRIDHFRGFESYWAVPYGSETAKNGQWRKGPGLDLVGRLTSWFGNVKFIAEDLGTLTPAVHKLLEKSGLPGMKVLEFAFEPETLSDYLPHNYPENCVCYTGTHDNMPLAGWYGEASAGEKAFAMEYLGSGDVCRAVLRCGMRSRAVLFMAQMQDYLALGAESRINTPGTTGGNWRWRMLPDALTPELAGKMHRMAYIYGRCGDNR